MIFINLLPIIITNDCTVSLISQTNNLTHSLSALRVQSSLLSTSWVLATLYAVLGTRCHRGLFSLTHLVIMRRQLMQQLSHTILLSGTVDVWHFVVGYLGEVQANLQEEGEKEEKISMKNEAD